MGCGYPAAGMRKPGLIPEGQSPFFCFGALRVLTCADLKTVSL